MEYSLPCAISLTLSLSLGLGSAAADADLFLHSSELKSSGRIINKERERSHCECY